MVTREVGFQFLCLPLTIALLLITGCQTKDIPRLEKSPSPLVVGNIEVETHPPSRSKPAIPRGAKPSSLPGGIVGDVEIAARICGG